MRWSAYETKDPYSDVVVHETAHLLHYPEAREPWIASSTGSKRFVDVKFRHRELFAYACWRERLFTGGSLQQAAKIPGFIRGEDAGERIFISEGLEIEEVAALVLLAARRPGWRVIREATEIHITQGRDNPGTGER